MNPMRCSFVRQFGCARAANDGDSHDLNAVAQDQERVAGPVLNCLQEA
jgi:hypothetical protein